MGSGKSKETLPLASNDALNGTQVVSASANDQAQQLPPTAGARKFRTLPADITPRAAVVGAGLAGLFTARELAMRGFEVTVFDASSRFGSGNIQDVIGVYGSGVSYHLAPWCIKLTREFIRGFRSRSESPFLSTETPPFRLLDTVVWNWAYHRMREKIAPEAERTVIINGLKRRTAEVMDQIHVDHPELKRHIIEEKIVRHTDAPDADFKQTLLDVPQWTRNFAQILQDHYDVTFKFSHNVTFLQLKLAYDDETVHHVHARDETNPDNVEVVALPFDLFVFAVGKKTTRFLWPNYTAPVLELGGCRVDLPLDCPLVQKLSGTSGSCDAAHGVVRWGHVRDAHGNTRMRLSGLWNANVRHKALSPEWAAYMLLRKGKIMPEGQVENVAALLPKNAEGVTVARYSRGFTPDGLPIVAKYGKCFNAFVLAGFGDDAMALAPGSAELLGRMIVKEVPSDASNPLTLYRFKTQLDFRPDDDKATWQERLWSWENKTALVAFDDYFPLKRALEWLLPVESSKPPKETMIQELPYQRRMREKAQRKRQQELDAARAQREDQEGGSTSSAARSSVQ